MLQIYSLCNHQESVGYQPLQHYKKNNFWSTNKDLSVMLLFRKSKKIYLLLLTLLMIPRLGLDLRMTILLICSRQSVHKSENLLQENYFLPSSLYPNNLPSNSSGKMMGFIMSFKYPTRLYVKIFCLTFNSCKVVSLKFVLTMHKQYPPAND